MPTLKSYQGDEITIKKFEEQLVARGYRKSNKTNENQLSPKEYIVRKFSGTEDSFEGPGGSTIFFSE